MLGFFSLLALGLMVAVAIALVGTGVSSGWSGLEAREALGPAGAFRLDYPSLVLGLALGLVMATLARLSWAEMPRRLAMWLIVNERNFYRTAMAAMFLGVMLFY